MHFSDNDIRTLFCVAGANLQRHHESQDEAARLLKEQNKLMAQQLEAMRAESARARGLVRYNGKDLTPEEHKRTVEREELERQKWIQREREVREEQERQARQQQEDRERLEREKVEREKARKVALQLRRAFDEKLKAETKAREKKKRADAAEEKLKLKAISHLDKQAAKCGDSLREKLVLNNLAKQMVAHVIAADGQFSSQELQWVESIWGHGASKWLIEIMREISLENTRAQISEVCGSSAGDSTIERLKNRFWSGKTFEQAVSLWAMATQLQYLAEVDGICEAESEVITNFQEAIGGERIREKLSAVAEAELVGCFENWKQANYMVYLGLRITAMLVQRDQYFTEAEISWVERYWGTGASTQIIELASIPDFNRLMSEVLEFSQTADKSTLLEFWLILKGLNELASLDGSESASAFYATSLLTPIKDKLLSPTSTKHRILA
jgi:hypothetical protein